MPARPSSGEVHEQVMRQHAHRLGDFEPHISAICCPFNPQAEDATSALNWIHISHPLDQLPEENRDPSTAGCKAFTLEVRRSLGSACPRTPVGDRTCHQTCIATLNIQSDSADGAMSSSAHARWQTLQSPVPVPSCSDHCEFAPDQCGVHLALQHLGWAVCNLNACNMWMLVAKPSVGDSSSMISLQDGCSVPQADWCVCMYAV